MKTKSIQSIKGTQDILPSEVHFWQEMERKIFEEMALFGFSEIRTPAFENTDLFSRSVGEQTDIVSKEMYTFEDRSGGSLTLKPEATASVVRAFIQHNLDKINTLTRLFYIDALFRRERPQKGRYRQFHQFGAELFGSEHPEADVEIVSLASSIFKSIGINEITLKINTIGSKSARDNYKIELKRFLKPHFNKLSEASRERFEKNPLRILDTKNSQEQEILSNAPQIFEYLSEDDKAHFSDVEMHLKDLNINFEFDPYLVRGLDYYNRTIFEFISNDIGSQNAICGGGRYDSLVSQLGGNDTPSIGFAAGMERILLAISKKERAKSIDCYIVCMGNKAQDWVLKCANKLRSMKFSVCFDLLKRSLKSQMKEANRLNAKHAIIIGENEIKDNKFQVKNLDTGKQQEVAFEHLTKYFKNL